jgi:uncharacterized protein (TIGR02117 family)
VIGGLIQRDVPDDIFEAQGEQEAVTVYLITGLLHADIAIPVVEIDKGRFGFLGETRLPFDNPNLRYLAFGWGSKAFYTTAGNYSDIRPGAVFTAVTGDDPVMRVTPVGALSQSETVIAFSLGRSRFDRLMEAIGTGFAKDVYGNPDYLSQYTIGTGDAFFAGTGHFNIFNPCNQWVGEALASAGIVTGIWTPTTHSLLLSIGRNP